MKTVSVRSVLIVMPARLGFHLRVIAEFVKSMQSFHSAISVRKNRSKADGKSVLELMLLAAPWKSRLNIQAKGDDAKQAIEGVRDFFRRQIDIIPV